MKTLLINEMDQTIVGPVALDGYVAPNEFLASLVARATRDGRAEAKDSEGCPVTATIVDDADPRNLPDWA